MQKNNQENVMKYIDDELTPLRISINELEEAIEKYKEALKNTNSSILELKKIVARFIGGHND